MIKKREIITRGAELMGVGEGGVGALGMERVAEE